MCFYMVQTVEKFETYERRIPDKAVEFMNHFQYSLSKFPENEDAEKFREYANNRLQTETKNVIEGNNKEVEKRYKYFVGWS